MTDFGFISNRVLPEFHFEAAPIHNILTSICLLNEPIEEISPWVDGTKAKLSEQERLMAGRACMLSMFAHEAQTNDFDEFLAQAEQIDPLELLKRAVEKLLYKAHMIPRLRDSLPTIETALSDVEVCVSLEKQMLEAEEMQEDEERLRREWEALFAGRQYVHESVEGIRALWDRYGRAEWNSVAPLVEESVRAFATVDYSAGALSERLKRAAERDSFPASWVESFSKLRKIVFVPSMHIGPFLGFIDSTETTAWLVIHARVPEGATIQSPRLDRSEMLMRLQTLSDDTRLRILEVAASHDTLTTQMVIDELGLSQSSASRHLVQLTATGILTVDGSERTKRYRLNRSRIRRVADELLRLFG